MIDGQFIRKDGESLAALFPASAEVRAEQLRQYLSSAELRSFGIDPAHGDAEAGEPAVNRLLNGVGAALSTTFLFVAVGYLTTLGLPDPATAIASVPATLA